MTDAAPRRSVPLVWMLVAVLAGFGLGTIATSYEGSPLHGTDWWIAGSSVLVAAGTGALAWQTSRMVKAAREEGSATARLAAGAELDRSIAFTARLTCDKDGAVGAAEFWGQTRGNRKAIVHGQTVGVFNLGKGNAERVSVWVNLQGLPVSSGGLVVAAFRAQVVPPSGADPTPLTFDLASENIQGDQVPTIFGSNAVDRAAAVILWKDGLGYFNRSHTDGTAHERWRPPGEGETLVPQPEWTVFFNS